MMTIDGDNNKPYYDFVIATQHNREKVIKQVTVLLLHWSACRRRRIVELRALTGRAGISSATRENIRWNAMKVVDTWKRVAFLFATHTSTMEPPKRLEE